MTINSLNDIKGEEHRLQVPLSESDIRSLTLGDIVYLDGEVFTGRALFYIHVLEKGNEPPVDIRRDCNVHMHSAPAGVEVSRGTYRLSSIQAAASFRYQKWVPDFMKKYGVRALIGKGGLSDRVYQDVFKPCGAVFLTTVGYGIGALYGRGVKGVKAVHWRDELGLPEAMWILSVENFGPFIVECDSQGRGLSSLGTRQVALNIAKAYEGLPRLRVRRLGEVVSPEEEII